MEVWQDAAARQAAGEPIIDIHQHLSYSGRPDEVLLAHQRAIGATQTILLPAGRSATRPSTHDGVANGLQVQALGNAECDQFSRSHDAFLYGANDVPEHTMLDKFPRVKFIGHAQLWWSNIDRNNLDPTVSYPKGPVQRVGPHRSLLIGLPERVRRRLREFRTERADAG